ncbi:MULTISPECIES: LysR family transcriptional regulator [unclassified Sphingomonas]|jgi:DNA-binding transcriptional LysR family regulator|uniref:LysR family transcriptional regulator n=1 Tax=unclassified Sphingomonas TaxID=196159 RepID=UPI0006FC9737|nr:MULTISPECIES: LysR family transcriptional regulator [unclassified Sphingomonas]KQN29357.1 LysR family transcriptional regulator [Sphingomonas sp. Leaf38]KQN31449.1 LysR family transcriptional regulator [Sphingomonas sp. Leaf34]
MRLPDLEAWAIFASVVEHRSFSAAADAIGLSKATVSKAITRLEAHLGQSLFHRTSRRLALTEAGKPLAEHAARILAEARLAEESANDAASAPTGRVRLAAPMSFGITNVAPLLAEFLAAHPGIEVDLHLSDARVDIVAEGFDVALRIAELPDSSLRARRLCTIHAHIVAAPRYLAEHGTPTHPAQLGEHRLFGYSNVVGPWRFQGPGGAEVSVRAQGPLTANSGEAILPALVAGLGIARLPAFIVGAALASGALVPILVDWAPAPIGLHLLTPPSPLRPARVEALIAFLTKRLRDTQ